jgi:hypothetical protein
VFRSLRLLVRGSVPSVCLADHLPFLLESSRSRPVKRKSRLHPSSKTAALPVFDPFLRPAGRKFPQDPPDVPAVGSASAPLVDLLAWHAEIHAAQHEQSAALAEQEAIAVVRMSANAQLRFAEHQESLVSSRVATAGFRVEAAWQRYIMLYGVASHKHPPELFPGRRKGPGRDKGKGRASPLPSAGRAEADAEVGKEEVVSRELEYGEGSAGPASGMDLS